MRVSANIPVYTKGNEVSPPTPSTPADTCIDSNVLVALIHALLLSHSHVWEQEKAPWISGPAESPSRA